ncbi:hypothetical protein [Paracoccus sp. (in: a-proteobacteria)]|uniref:hypothetical protein n=1 Tax=Paracoccus sp. TaxID=267 RepID=UPI002F4114A2
MAPKAIRPVIKQPASPEQRQADHYAWGREEAAGKGSIKAPFAGEHGWFWRNRDAAAVTMTLKLRGTYAEDIET